MLLTELKADLNAYLATTPPSVKTRTLAQLIAFNRADPRELSLFGQELFELAQKTKGLRDPAYLAARRRSLHAAGADGIDTLIDANHLDALVAPMGDVRGLPVGLSFIGKAWTEATLLALGAAYEAATRHRRAPTYAPSIEATPALTRILARKR